jgi:Putative MetA-pathway of phenol degradation
MQRLLALAAALAAGSAQAGIIFTPHLSEYSKLPHGQYTEFMFVHTTIEDVYDRTGKRIHLGAPYVPKGESVEANIALMKFLWIGNVFRDSGIPVLSDHAQFCRVIGGLGWQQSSRKVVERGRLFGLTGGGNGLTDVFGLCGIYTGDYRFGPLTANGLVANTVKFPVGRFDREALLNTGTNYWSTIPQVALHAELWGRLILDATASYQFNGDNDQPAYGGMTPTRIADWRTQEVNLAFKWSEHWFTDVGFSHRESVGPNRFDQVTVSYKDPIPAQQACDNTNNGLGIPIIDPSLCNSSNRFYVTPKPGTYADRGIYGDALTAGVYYVYRTSSVLNLRVFYPLAGRGSQIDVDFEVCSDTVANRPPCTTSSPNYVSSLPDVLLNGVQEAAATSASPYIEARFVYLFWAP